MGREQVVLEEIASRFPGSEIKPAWHQSLFGYENILFLGEEILTGKFTRARFYVAIMPVKCVRADIYTSLGYQFSLATPFSAGIRERYNTLQSVVRTLSQNSVDPNWEELELIDFYKLLHPIER